MRTRASAVAALCALLLSCDPLARSELSLTFDEKGEDVAVRVESDEEHLKLNHADERDRIGEEVLAGRDEWSLRFAAASAENERISLQRAKGQITAVTQEGRIRAAELQKFFFDVGVAVEYKRLEDSVELNLYPGASNRATRQQRATVDAKLERFASLAARYFESLRAMYAFMDANETRVEPLFVAALTDKTEEMPALSEREKTLAADLREAATAVYEESEGGTKDLARLADLAYNPFPAALAVKVPGEILSIEGFKRDRNGVLTVSSATPIEALVALEGRWAEPDPLALALRSEKAEAPQLAGILAAQPRRVAATVSSRDILAALTGSIRPAPRYHVRWSAKPAPARDRAGR